MPKNLNRIERVSIGALMDGRYFYIPDYQRGYRWTPQQVKDLLRDLLIFIGEKQKGDFYSLQPIIARKMTQEQYESVFGKDIPADVAERGLWEIVDGQQRLTTLLILYKYLLREHNISQEALKTEEGKEMYHIFYQTRQQSNRYLSTLGTEGEDETEAENNVDYYYMREAYHAIQDFLKDEAKQFCSWAHGSMSKMANELFRLLNGSVGAEEGSVQVIWYELPENEEVDSVSEFQKINNGKIKLTDAELIKALLLRTRIFDKHSASLQQEQRALEWEQIENRLHDDAFWGFICKTDSRKYAANRIDFIFSLLYKFEHKNEYEKDDLADERKSVIFRYFSGQLEHLESEALHEKIADIWKSVRNIFWMLEDWYHHPITYNLIGLLTQMGVDVTQHALVLEKMKGEEGKSRQDFVLYLSSTVSKHLGVSLEEIRELSYNNKNKKQIRMILLAANIALLNKLCSQEISSDSSMYKFPFAEYAAGSWDIEHIASYHDKELTSTDAEEWIKTALEDVKLSAEDSEKLKKMTSVQKIVYLQEVMQEHEYDDETKNSLGNLTLLDSGTNRSYGNALFCTKRRYIIERVDQGQFVPSITQHVFFKLSDKTGTNRSVWTQQDMANYKTKLMELLNVYYNTETI